MKVLMVPHLKHFRTEESGIKTVVQKYWAHLPRFGIEFVEPDATSYDLKVAHAGTAGGDCDVSHCHGLYFTADYEAAAWEWKANESVIQSIRGAREITVPSTWIAEVLQRDMHVNPHVINHGVDWDEWQHDEPNEGYVLGYAKNRVGDVCNPVPMNVLARRFPKLRFLGTFAAPDATPNIRTTGVIPHAEMKKMVQRSAVFVNTTKESGGIAILEAMAAGIPVLGYAHGGILDTVQHGVSGYLARPGDLDDLAEGLDYCLRHRAVLGANGREMARAWTWQKVAEQVAAVYRRALREEPATVSVVIPVYNKEATLERAVRSVLDQSFAAEKIIIVDDGSTDDSSRIGRRLAKEHESVVYLRQRNSGVAHARNRGIRDGRSAYICCLDADDWIAPEFLERCMTALAADRTLGIAYTRLMTHLPDGREVISDWPGEFDYDAQLRRKNQVPTCAVFRREAWARAGGYRARYAPDGAGSEDAAFWTHVCALGYGAALATNEPLFHYSAGQGHTSQPGYSEADWLEWFPWSKDGQHPFASVATPAKFSHPVRQYDEPIISVVIPVGPGHEETVRDALDSLEAQTFRRWEAIVVDDSGSHIAWDLKAAYPFVRWVDLPGGKGTGAARNKGARFARAPFLLFLDADDWLMPQALARMLAAWNETQSAVYSDYQGIAVVENPDDLAPALRGRLYAYDAKAQEATIGYRAAEYDCHRAQRQPENPPYLWCNVTTLVPRVWHDEIGGFDGAMESWEDVDYFYRLARAGRCFVRVPEELMVYRFRTGSRRETGRQQWESLLDYMRRKYKGATNMPCNGCGKKRASSPPAAPRATVMASRDAGPTEAQMADGDLVMVRLVDGHRGMHRIVGHATKTDYKYRKHGDEFLVHRRDIAAKPSAYEPVTEGVKLPEAPKVETAAPQPVDGATVIDPSDGIDAAEASAAARALRQRQEEQSAEERVREIEDARQNRPFDPQLIPGVTRAIARQWPAELDGPAAIVAAGLDGLTAINGIGDAKAELILSWAKEQ